MESSDWVSAVNEHMTGFDRMLGLEITGASPGRVEAQLTIAACHTQIHGYVHGGVYASMVETLGSIGAALSARSLGRTVVGLENHTSFLRAVREGQLTAVSVPIGVGRRTQIWNTQISDAEGRLVAVGQLRLLCVELDTLPNASLSEPQGPFNPEGTTRST